MVAPDDTTFAYLQGRPLAPKGAALDAAVAQWRTLSTDPDAIFDREVAIDVASLSPDVTWGTSPEEAAPVTGRVPDPASRAGPEPSQPDAPQPELYGPVARHALLGDRHRPGLHRLLHQRPDRGFATAAAVVAGRRVSPNVSCIVVPGSASVRRAAEAEGLDRIFRDAGLNGAIPAARCALR